MLCVHSVLGVCIKEGLHESHLDRCYLLLKVVDTLNLGVWDMECLRDSRTLLSVFSCKMGSPVLDD